MIKTSKIVCLNTFCLCFEHFAWCSSFLQKLCKKEIGITQPSMGTTKISNLFLGSSIALHAGPWSFQLLSCSPYTTGLALGFTLLCPNSDDLFKAFIVQIEAFSIIIELSHKILWEEFRIKTNHKVRPGIKGSV